MRTEALRLFSEQNATTLLKRIENAKDTDALLGRVDCIFSDIDGTLTQEGATALPLRVTDYFRRLHGAGVTVVLVSGKPYEEILPLMQSLPSGLGVSALYEKGGYRLDSDAKGTWLTTYLLSSHDLEHATAELRLRMPDLWKALQAKYAHERICFGWAGSGKHRSLLSVDVFTGDVPADYTNLTGVDRGRLKLQDANLLRALEVEFRKFVNANYPDWGVVHLGNANFEIAPPGIEKDVAVQQTLEFQEARGVLVLGDSGNDLKMLSLRQSGDVLAGLVFHNSATIRLVDSADFVAFGRANPFPIFDHVFASVMAIS